MEVARFREEMRLHENLPEGAAERATKIALKTILARVRGESAVEVRSHLPEEWQTELTFSGELDTSVTSATVLNEIGGALNISTERAQKILPRISRALAKFIPQDVLFRAFMQLPYEMRSKLDIGDERLHAKDIDMYTVRPEMPGPRASSIEEFLTKKVVVLKRTDTLRAAALAMAENNVGCVVVSDSKGELVGMLTDRDLACTSAVVKDGLDAPISEAMSEGDLVMAGDTEDLRAVIEKMVDHGVRRVPIMTSTAPGARAKCLGLISLDDLLLTKSVSLLDASRIAAQQIHPTPHRASRTVLRSMARKTQTAIRFASNLAQKLGLDEKNAEEAAKIVLRLFIRRVNAAEAAQLITQLPSVWQDEFYDLVAGPDKSIGAGVVLESLALHLKSSREEAAGMLNKIVNALADLTSRGEVVDLVSQLPSDIQELLDINPGSRSGKRPADGR